MLAHLRPAFVLTILFTALAGIAYPLGITVVAQGVFPFQASGSPVTRDGVVVGSALIGQSFVADRYFHGRPSATVAPDPADSSKTVDSPYNAASSTGSNLGPSSTALGEAVKERAAALGPGPQPADLVTASGSGLDPDISPAGAFAQVPRVARARSLDEQALRDLVARHTQPRLFGVLGEPRLNVLALNQALDMSRP